MESGKLKLSGQLAFVPKETYPCLVVHPPPLSLTSLFAPRSLRTSACMPTPPPYYMEPQLCSSFLKYFLNTYNYVYIVLTMEQCSIRGYLSCYLFHSPADCVPRHSARDSMGRPMLSCPIPRSTGMGWILGSEA